MKRRAFITLLGGAAAWPVAARAQQPKMPVIGVLNDASFESRRERFAAFHLGLAETGYIEGRNVTVEYRWAENDFNRLPTLAMELVRRQVDVIATSGSMPAALAAKAATRTIPIAFLVGADPVEAGLVANLARPGGNLTGATILQNALIPKRIEFLHELVPTAPSIALLTDPTNLYSSEEVSRMARDAAQALGVRLLVLNARSQSDIPAAFATLAEQRIGAVVVVGDSLFIAARNQVVMLAARHQVPAIYGSREDAVAGGLLSYGADIVDSYRQVGIYAGRILNGERPADLPVQQPTKIQMFINLKTAKALGITFPLALLTRADEVIE
jgi:putative ABC transport system substrate-binding protein